MSLTPRATKGSGLTNDEGDAVFNTIDGRITTAQAAADAANTNANNRVPYSRTVGGQPLSSNILMKTVGGQSLVGSTGDIPLSGGATTTAISSTIPLDAAGDGKYMPPRLLSANDNIVPGPTKVNFGNCTFCLVGDGAGHVPTFTGFNLRNGYTYSSAENANNIYTAVWLYGTALLYGELGDPVDTVAPSNPSSAVVTNASTDRLDIVWPEAMDQTSVPAPSAFGITGTHPITAHAFDDATHSHLTFVGAPFVNGEAARFMSYTQPLSNRLKDLAGNEVPSFSGFAITNNVGGSGASDSFNRGDNLSSLGTASDAVAWVHTDLWGIETNKARNTTPAGTATGPSAVSLAHRPGIGSTTYTESCAITVDVGNPGLLLRYVDDNNWFCAYLDATDTSVHILECVAGVLTPRAASGTGQYSPPGPVTLAIHNDGSSGAITATVNGGATVCSYTSAVNKTVTAVGLLMGGSSVNNASRWDDWGVS